MHLGRKAIFDSGLEVAKEIVGIYTTRGRAAFGIGDGL